MAAAEFKQEAELMARYCDGDQAAFHRLYGLLAPRILGYLVGLVGERATAEDLLQQTFLKLHVSRATYVRFANPIPWLYTIAHRTCLDELRKRKRAPVKLTADGVVPDVAAATMAGGREEDARETGPHITLAALDGLPQNQREALVLTKVHGHSIAEAARITGSTPGAIKLRAHRAYVTLRMRLGRRPPAAEKIA
ncbi:MAG TPA: RNA polymerase sigma factor [Polyangia bacterium]|nr:RNA polymerase sigma factor [Polyangia bacterium]